LAITLFLKTGNARRLGVLLIQRGDTYRNPGRAVSSKRGLCLHSFRQFQSQRFARSLGAIWAGDSNAWPPAAAFIFVPVGELVPVTLKTLGKSGGAFQHH